MLETCLVVLMRCTLVTGATGAVAICGIDEVTEAIVIDGIDKARDAVAIGGIDEATGAVGRSRYVLHISMNTIMEDNWILGSGRSRRFAILDIESWIWIHGKKYL